ncbi:hypothetical protein ACSBOB_32110 [Mesorhizobium sp. ASY16-5R]|uniref:hypothetical protein n=1 Tax=Mesorhizobium sp. ASY16-5R TaxID=3445772 RepID=UPI003F9EC7A2
MPLFKVETTYHLPVYRRRTYEAANPEEACRLAIDDRWEDGKEDVDTPGETYVTGPWRGRRSGPPFQSDLKKPFSARRRRSADCLRC